MSLKTVRGVLKSAITRYGYGQFDKSIEELGELHEEIQKFKESSTYDEVDLAGIVEEVADVLIMCWQIVMILDIKSQVKTLIYHKAHKLRERMEREDINGKYI